MGRLPTTVGGRPLPDRLQRETLRWLDPDWVLVEVVDWFEREYGGGRQPAQQATALREGRALATACSAIRDRLSSDALTRMITDALGEAGIDPDEPEPPQEHPAQQREGAAGAGQGARRGLWPAMPTQVLGEPLPERLRRRVGSADQLLIDLAAWLEQHPAQRAPAHPDAARGRDVLVRACIALRERLSDPGLDGLLAGALRDAGVQELSSDGELFEPARHRGVGQRPTTDPALHDHVAETERLGYADRGHIIQFPEVIVYRLAGADGHR